jgi:hypothetical protein
MNNDGGGDGLWEYQYDVIDVQHYIQNGRKKTKVKKKKRRVPSCGTS